MEQAQSTAKPVAILLAPARHAISGVTTHLNLMIGSRLAQDFALIHFQVGSQGRDEGVAGRAWRLVSSPLILALRILLAKADIVHINSALNRRAWWRDLGYAIVAKLCGARVVFQVHGGDLPRRFARVNAVPAPLLRIALELPDAVVVLATCELAAYREFVPRQEVFAMPNGIDLSSRHYRSRLPRDPSAPLRLVYIGRLAPRKGLPETLQAMAIARTRNVAATLAIAGGGPDEAMLKQLAAQLGLADTVRFVGPVFNGDKQALLDSADVMLLPSYNEGLPYALLEAMAAGVPVITTRVGGIPDVMEDRVHGVFVPIGSPRAIAEAIEHLAAHPAQLAVMSLACRQRIVRAYTIDRMAGDIAGLYRSLCGIAPTAAEH